MPAAILTRLRSLSPLGPIFSKELRTTSRRKRTYLLRFAYLGALLLILLVFYSVMRLEVAHAGSVARRAQRLAQMGAGFFAVFSFFSLGAMAIAGPVLTSTAINSERLHKTLPVLLMTPISAWQIVAGKLFSRLLIALTLLGLSLPVLAIVRLLGGVEIEQMFGVVCICIAVAFFTASVGLFLSSILNRAYSVILLSYAFLGFLYMFLPFVIVMILSAIFSGTPGPPRGFTTMMEIAGVLHPALPVAFLSIPDRPPFRLPPWQWCVAAHMGMAAVLTLLSAFQLRRIARRESEGGGSGPATAVISPPHAFPVGPIPMPDSQMPPALGGVVPTGSVMAAPPPHRPTPTRAVSDNPVLWRETRRPMFGRRWQGIAAGAVMIGFLLFVYVLMSSNNALTDSEAQIPFAFIFCVMLNILACVLSATAIAQEKESDTWTLLLATPLGARQIVYGKLLGILRRLAPLTAIIIVHFFLFALGGVIDVATFTVVVWMTITTNLIWVATGLYLSLRIKRVTFAVMLNLAGPLILYLLPLAILAIIFGSGPYDDIIEVVGLYCPYPYMAIAIEHYDGRYGQREMWLPLLGYVRDSEFAFACFATGIGHIAVSTAVVVLTMLRFDQIVGRAPQTAPLPEGAGGVVAAV